MDRKISVYLASPWADKEQTKIYAQQFREAGLNVVSRWHDFHEDKPTDGLQYDVDVLMKEALADVEDVLACDIFVLFNTQPRGQETSGKAVETGVAIAACKGIVLVGERTNVFHYLDIPQVRTVEEAIEAVKNYPWKPGQIDTDVVATGGYGWGV